MELAELFAILPNTETIPGFDIGWRPEDPEEFILSACSTLVTVVNVCDEKVVQFSHFSVREYLTSNRIASSEYVSHFHALSKPAHTLLSRACLSVLLQLDYCVDRKKVENFPLAWYAAEYWVDHAHFGDISLDIRDGMDYLFDKDKPHLAAWIWLYDVEHSRQRQHYPSTHPMQPDAVPLYYAALVGFHDLADRLLDAHPQDVHFRGGYHYTPLHAALNKGHRCVALLLLERGAEVDSRGLLDQTPLYVASSHGCTEVAQSLLNRSADPNAVCRATEEPGYSKRWTPLLVASYEGRLETVRVLLEYGADVNFPEFQGRSPLHIASSRHHELVQLLLEYGANLGAMDEHCNTALHNVIYEQDATLVKLFLQHGANLNARSVRGATPLHCAAAVGLPEIVQQLLDYGADPNARNNESWTPLHEAAHLGYCQVVGVLLERGADPLARTDRGMTSFQWASIEGYPQIAQLISERTGEREEDIRVH